MNLFEWAILATSTGTLITMIILLKKQTTTVPNTLKAIAAEMLIHAIAERSVSQEAATNPTEYLEWCRKVQQAHASFLETLEGVETLN